MQLSYAKSEMKPCLKHVPAFKIYVRSIGWIRNGHANLCKQNVLKNLQQAIIRKTLIWGARDELSFLKR